MPGAIISTSATSHETFNVAPLPNRLLVIVAMLLFDGGKSTYSPADRTVTAVTTPPALVVKTSALNCVLEFPPNRIKMSPTT